MLRKLSVGLGVGLVLLACGSESSSEFPNTTNTNQDAGGSIGFDNDAGPPPPSIECRKMDIVFVIDNSSSMKEEQAALASNFPGFIKLINEYKTAAGELLDYRIAVVSTDLGHGGGVFQRERGSAVPGDGGLCGPGDTSMPWLERHDGIDDEFACRAQLGVLGDNRELPLECARTGLTQRITDGVNAHSGNSFVREDALLALVIITDEDDGGGDHDQVQKPTPVDTPANYAKSFDTVKGGYRGRWATAVIAGERYCLDGKFGTADQAVRLQEFASLAKPNSVFSSICSQDFTTSLKDAFDVFSNACKGFPEVR